MKDLRFSTTAKRYEIDYSKVKTVEDVINILKGLDIMVYDNYEKFEELKPYLTTSIK